MMANSPAIYRLAPTLEFLQRNWGDECVVYITTSRETHLLNAPCTFVLGVLERSSASAGELIGRMQEALNDAEPQEVSHLVQEVVDQLSRIGMIEALEDAS